MVSQVRKKVLITVGTYVVGNASFKKSDVQMVGGGSTWPKSFDFIGRQPFRYTALSSSERSHERIHKLPEVIASVHWICDGHSAFARCCSIVYGNRRLQRCGMDKLSGANVVSLIGAHILRYLTSLPVDEAG